ncbi:DnaJ (Hsp40), sub C, member 17 [Chamberlinius hualienensis]
MASKTEDVTKLDLYDLLGINSDAGLKEIKTAYRKTALTCHPDKNPDNPDAAKLFHQLLKALEILTDTAAREAYDKILKARKATALRNKLLDSKRKKLKEELESREKEAELEKTHFVNTSVDAEAKLRQEIERLRKEGSKQVEEEVAFLKEQIKIEKERLSTDGSPDPYTDETLKEIFQRYGEIMALFLKESAFRCEIGYSAAPLEISWLTKPPTFQPSKQQINTVTSTMPGHFSNLTTEDDYESTVLTKLRQAQERKKIIEEMQKEDCDTT